MYEVSLLTKVLKRYRMKKFWNSIEDFHGVIPEKDRNYELEEKNEILQVFEDEFLKQNSSRRGFLKVFGFTLSSAAVISACKRPVQKAMPYVIQPLEITPGKALYYATTFYDGHEYCSILVKTRDGRPIKIEPNDLSVFNKGTSARVQASILSLYDDARLKEPLSGGAPIHWEGIDMQISDDLERINSEKGRIVLLTPTVISPTTVKLINEFGSRFNDFQWIQYDAISCSGVLEANQKCFGKAVFPDYHFQNASLVVSVNADFLGTWGAPLHFITEYVSRRRPEDIEKPMLRHVQFESGMTLTGCNADERIKIKPSEERSLLTDLYNRIATITGAEKMPGEKFREDLSELAACLIAARGRSIVVSGTNDTELQIIVNGINNMLGNYPSCIDLENNIRLAAGTDISMENLVNEMNAGEVKALLMYNINPLYDYPDYSRFLSGLKKTVVSVNMSTSLNESAGISKYECPVNHYLESWDDAEIIPGDISLSQPCISPIFNTRSFQDSLLRWSGSKISWHDYLVSNWENEYFSKSDSPSFSVFWNSVLGNGVFNYKPSETEPSQFNSEALATVMNSLPKPTEGYEIVFYESVAIGNGKHSNNPWLMELPDPVSKHCWENVAFISPADSLELGIGTGDLIRLDENIAIPALIQPGQTEKTISIALGYGHTNSGPVADNAGVNVFHLIRFENGNRKYGYSTGKIEKTGENKLLALTQTHNSMEGRPIVRETVLSEFRKNPSSGNELHTEYEEKHKTLYPEVNYDGFHWGMAIDLNKCIGCNTCVIACQAENNIPVVGREEVRKRRIMHWLKIDRYYSETPDNPKVYFQPLTCMHCDNAPCENVCPVSATNHSSEGLNQMAYNRCVGTKYCINNCPYKVRRFNWFRYTNNKAFDFHTTSDLGKMVLNPDVTVRERGVVEKCTFCVQRIQEKKLQAKLENRTLRDNEIQPACMQACPAGAIVFGNMKDKNSKVSQMLGTPRNYHLLEELHTLPSVGYLTKVWNDVKLKS